MKLEITNLNKKVDELNKNTLEKNNELNKVKLELNNLKLEYYDNNIFKEILPGEKIISILFNSTDQRINYSLPCKSSTPFIKVEERLYDEYPEYKKTDNYFLTNGKKIKRFLTIEENQIISGKPVILIQEV